MPEFKDFGAEEEPDFDFPVAHLTECPQCGSTSLEYKGEAYDDDEHQGSAYRCDECGLSFDEQSARDGTW